MANRVRKNGLLIAIQPKLNPRLMTFLSGLAGLLVLIQVFAMRWNVVVGGQIFSKSFRGFVEYPLHWFGREGLLAAAVVLTLPLLALWAFTKLLPIWQLDETEQTVRSDRIHSVQPS